MKKHLEECKNEHLEIMAVKCTKLEALVTDLQYAFSLIAPLPLFIPPPEMVMNNFEKHGIVLPLTLTLVGTICVSELMPMDREMVKVLMLVYLCT